MLDKITTLGGKINFNFQTIGAIAAAVLILLGVVKMFTEEEAPPEVVAIKTYNVGDTGVKHLSTTQQVKDRISAEGQRRAGEAIAEHEKAIAADFNGEDTPDRLIAVANLQQYQLSDYYSAIQNYRTVVDMSPDHSKVPQAYIEIATCYEKLGDEMQARYVYQEMVDNLDPSLQHAIFAKQKIEEG
jgi:tetratricopeptide (TPR) repeat protein